MRNKPRRIIVQQIDFSTWEPKGLRIGRWAVPNQRQVAHLCVNIPEGFVTTSESLITPCKPFDDRTVCGGGKIR